MSSPGQDSFLGNYFEQALRELASAQDLLTDAADFVRTHTPAPQGVGIDRATDDPHVILRFGQLRARLHAAEGLLARARRLAGASGPPTPVSARAPNAAAASASPPLAATRTSPTTASPTPVASVAAPITTAPALTTAATVTTAPAVTAPPLTTAALVALLEAHAFASDLVAEIGSQLFAWGGPLRSGQQRGDANGHFAPLPANQYHHAGNYYLKGVVPPTPEPRP